MRNPHKINALSLVPIVLFLLFTGCRKDQSASSDGRSITLTHEVTLMDFDDNEITTVRVALADTPNKQALGLMDVRALPNDGGMLFIFQNEEPRSFWMVNTPLPLDIIYMDRNGKIVRIRPNTVPFSDAQIPSDYPSKYVLEVHAGFSARHDIQEGMRIRLPEL